MLSPCDKWLAGFYGKLPFEEYVLLDRSARTLAANSGNPGEILPWSPKRGITPSAIGFHGLWNWDSAFAAIGAAYFDPSLARQQIEIFLDIQEESGLLPDVWRKEGDVVGGYGKPPVFPWAAWRVYESARDDTFLRRCYDGFVKNEVYWRKYRGGDANGLFNYSSESTDAKERYTNACYESGWDNSVRWDNGIESIWPVDLNCYMVMFYRAMSKMADALGENSDVFLEREKQLLCKIETTLWNEDAKCYLDYDFLHNTFVNVLTPASYMPLYIESSSPDRAAVMAEHAKRLSPGWPSVSYDDPHFNPHGYWRGRTWYNIAYFALKGLKNYSYIELAEQGRSTLLEWALRDSGQLCENYHPVTGAPVGVPQFSWTATFVMEFILNWNTAHSR